MVADPVALGSQPSFGEDPMRRTTLNLDTFLAVIFLAGCCITVAVAQDQKTFPSPTAAGIALFSAVQSNDERAILEVLGPEARKLVSSGDDTEDANDRATFVRRYQEMHRLVREPDGSTMLYIGASNWPMPIPLVMSGQSWRFDTEAGKQEILYRRVGANEISTIRICQALVAAQKEYYALQHNRYAAQFFSDPGQENGLYWQAIDGRRKSPIGPLVASADAAGYRRPVGGMPSAYHGYLYRILIGQGRNAPGGAKSYIQNGKMNGGFAFIAYPAEYRSSGVMTFLVGKDGVVHEKDLGRNTEDLARAMKAYNPDSSWRHSEDAQEKAAALQDR
ncbi:MAG: DUF2950 domain-containing protein [Steroidobacteraceae bacterium]